MGEAITPTPHLADTNTQPPSPYGEHDRLISMRYPNGSGNTLHKVVPGTSLQPGREGAVFFGFEGAAPVAEIVERCTDPGVPTRWLFLMRPGADGRPTYAMMQMNDENVTVAPNGAVVPKPGARLRGVAGGQGGDISPIYTRGPDGRISGALRAYVYPEDGSLMLDLPEGSGVAYGVTAEQAARNEQQRAAVAAGGSPVLTPDGEATGVHIRTGL